MFGSVKPTTRKGMNSIKNNEEAVSPVIGVILMVAVTVILAAVIAAFIFGFTGNMPKAPNVAYFHVERLADGATISISTTTPNIVEITLLDILMDGTTIGTDKITELKTTGKTTVTDTSLTTSNTLIINGSVSGLPVQTLQKITV